MLKNRESKQRARRDSKRQNGRDENQKRQRIMRRLPVVNRARDPDFPFARQKQWQRRQNQNQNRARAPVDAKKQRFVAPRAPDFDPKRARANQKHARGARIVAQTRKSQQNRDSNQPPTDDARIAASQNAFIARTRQTRHSKQRRAAQRQRPRIRRAIFAPQIQLPKRIFLQTQPAKPPTRESQNRQRQSQTVAAQFVAITRAKPIAHERHRARHQNRKRGQRPHQIAPRNARRAAHHFESRARQPRQNQSQHRRQPKPARDAKQNVVFALMQRRNRKPQRRQKQRQPTALKPDSLGFKPHRGGWRIQIAASLPETTCQPTQKHKKRIMEIATRLHFPNFVFFVAFVGIPFSVLFSGE